MSILSTVVLAGISVGAVPASASPTPAATQAAAVGAPFGSLDLGEYVPGGIGVKGWVAYKGSPQKSLKVHIKLDGKLLTGLSANQPRPDVAKKYPGVTTNTGFSSFLPTKLAAGTHTVCAFAIKPAGAPGGNPNIGCRSFTTGDSPIGTFAASALREKSFHVVGSVGDPNTVRAIKVKVTLDGKVQNTITANKKTFVYEEKGKKTTVSAYGHGFDLALKLPAGGKAHQLCVTAINATSTPGGNVTGCISVK